MMTTLMTPLEVGQMLGVNEQTLRNWRRERSGPTYIRVGRQVRYRESDIHDFLEANENRPLDDDAA
jgi:excisionase family DNA binding protein